MVPHHGIQDYEQFMHTGGHDNFIRFSVLFEPDSQIANDRVAAFCGEGGHIEGASDLFSAAPDMGLAVPFSTGSVPGSQSDQGGDFLAVEFPQFGQVADEHSAGLRANAGGTLDNAIFAFEVVIGVDLVPDELVNFRDLEIERFDHLSDALFDFHMADQIQPVGLLGAQVIELASSSDQFGQLASLGCGVCFGGRFDHLGKLSQDGGIDGIGLGVLTDALSEVAYLTRIDDDHIQAGIEQFDGEGAFIAAGGLKDDQGDGVLLEGLAELTMSLRGVGQIEFKDAGAGGDREGVLGDIDTDIDGFRHGTFPFLRMRTHRASGPAVQTAVRAIPTGATRFPLRDGLGGPDTIELSPPAGVGSTRCAPLCAGLRSTPRAAPGYHYETVIGHVCQYTRHEDHEERKK